jgi:hypothetical protein
MVWVTVVVVTVAVTAVTVVGGRGAGRRFLEDSVA